MIAALSRRLAAPARLAAGALASAGLAASPPAAAAVAQPGFPAGARFYVPPPSDGAPQQIRQLLASGDRRDAGLLAAMEAVPRAVWLTGGTPGQVARQVRATAAAAAAQRAEPVFAAYDIPGRDCAQYSAGGALSQADYQAWIGGLARGLGHRRAVIILEPDGLGNLPSNCGLPASVYPFTDTERLAEISFAVKALGRDPAASVYLDGTHSAWQSVGTITQRLLAADVQHARGVFVTVSNYQPVPQLTDYGTWIADCIAIVTDPANPGYQNPAGCASQYFPATPGDFSTWHLTTEWYAQHLDGAVPATHFVIDTSRNGNGPNSMQAYANPPYSQPASAISTLAGGNWCNSPGAGLGPRPAASPGPPLLDAYLWVKTPGQSDGQCDAAGGVRAWDYTAYSQPGWPTTAAGQQAFDPLWGVVDPAAGGWFSQQALQLAQLANPALRPLAG